MSHLSGLTFEVWQSGPFHSSRGFLGAWGAWDAWTCWPTKPSGECWLWIKTSGSFYHLFTVFPWINLCRLWSCPEDYSIQSLTGIPPHAASWNGATALPSWKIFSLLPELFQCSNTPVHQVRKWLSHWLPSLLYWSSVQPFFFFFFFPLLASAKGETYQRPWCHTLRVTFPCWDRPSLRCRFSWSSSVSL